MVLTFRYIVVVINVVNDTALACIALVTHLIWAREVQVMMNCDLTCSMVECDWCLMQFNDMKGNNTRYMFLVSSGPVTITVKKTATELNWTGKKPNQSVAVIQFLEIISCSCLNLGSKKDWLPPVGTGYFRGIQRVPYVPGMQGKTSTFKWFFQGFVFFQGKYRLDLYDVSGKVVLNDRGNVEVFSHGYRGST